MLSKSRFIEMFGYIDSNKLNFKMAKLSEVAKIGSSHRVFTDQFVDKGVPFYRGTEISQLSLGQRPTDIFYISEELFNSLATSETKPKIGDLLLPSICNKGQIWLVDTDEPFYYKDGRVLRVSPDRNIFNSEYLRYYMSLKTKYEYLKLGTGSTFAEFKIFQLKNLDVIVPPKNLQNCFASFINKINKSKLVLQKALENLVGKV